MRYIQIFPIPDSIRSGTAENLSSSQPGGTQILASISRRSDPILHTHTSFCVPTRQRSRAHRHKESLRDRMAGSTRGNSGGPISGSSPLVTRAKLRNAFSAYLSLTRTTKSTLKCSSGPFPSTCEVILMKSSGVPILRSHRFPPWYPSKAGHPELAMPT